jgi:hypothetical protein
MPAPTLRRIEKRLDHDKGCIENRTQPLIAPPFAGCGLAA